MSGEGTAPSYQGRKPQKDVMDGKPAGGQPKAATAGEASGSAKGKSPSKKDLPGKNPVRNSTRDKGY